MVQMVFFRMDANVDLVKTAFVGEQLIFNRSLCQCHRHITLHAYPSSGYCGDLHRNQHPTNSCGHKLLI